MRQSKLMENKSFDLISAVRAILFALVAWLMYNLAIASGAPLPNILPIPGLK